MATEEALAFPYLALWGFPEKLHRKPPESVGHVPGLPASAGVVEGMARLVMSPDEFDAVKKGEIVACRMPSPAWVVPFTRVSCLVTGPGRIASHPAVVPPAFR